jgi:hypothetical protein
LTLKTFKFDITYKVKVPNNSVFGKGSVRKRRIVGTPLLFPVCTHYIGVFRYY